MENMEEQRMAKILRILVSFCQVNLWPQQSPSRFAKKVITFSTAILNVERMHECCPKHWHIVNKKVITFSTAILNVERMHECCPKHWHIVNSKMK